MTTLNIHSNYIDQRINDIRKSSKWNSILIDTSHENFIQDFGSCVFTNLVHDVFTPTYLKKFPCSDCNNPSQDRCHGINEGRLLLIKRALDKVWSDTTKPIIMKQIIIVFLEEHKYTKFTFKCHNCHVNEKNK
jgi:hypothetical protein